MATTLQTIKNAMVGHGWAVQAIKACRDIRVGLVENAQASVPLWASEENIGAARRAFRQRNQAILLPALSQGKNDFLDNSPEYTADEMKAAATPIDFLGFNYYKADTVIPSDDSKGFEILKNPLDFPKTDMGWTINPEGLYWSLRFINELAPAMPIFITENGIALRDRVEEDGSIRDIDRIQYMRSHLASVAKALEEDIPVKGYFAWSLLDNFEWASGYAKRFGLVRVDYQSMERRVKESGKYYGEIIRRRTLL